MKILDLSHALKEQKNAFQAREDNLLTGLFEVLDAFENVEETIKAKEDGMDKTARRLAKNVQSIRKSLSGCSKPMVSSNWNFPMFGQVWIPARWWRPGFPKRWETK